MAFREVNGISKFNHAAQEVRPRSEALDDAGNLLSSRTGAPKVVSRGGFPGGLGIFDDPDFGGRFRGWGAVYTFGTPGVALFILRHRSSISSNPLQAPRALRLLKRPRRKTIRSGNKLAAMRMSDNNIKTLPRRPCTLLHGGYSVHIIDSSLHVPIIAELRQEYFCAFSIRLRDFSPRRQSQ
jgi:hypothetical protein